MTRKPLSKKIRFRVFQRDNFTCQYCGRSAPDVELHVDHIYPVTHGGGDEMSNLITSCADCNLGKGKLSAVLQKKIDVCKDVRPLLKDLSDDEIEDITSQMLAYDLYKLDFRTLVAMVYEIGHIRGWCDGLNWYEKKIGNR